MPGSDQPLAAHNNILQHIVHNELPINDHPHILPAALAPGKRQLETNRACPQIWVENVHDDEEEQEEVVAQKADVSSTKSDEGPNSDRVLAMAKWLLSIQTHGFSPAVLQKYLRPDIDEEDEDDTWWEESIVRVFLPYYDLQKEDIAQVEDGRVNNMGDPIGRCTVRLNTGDEITGSFRPDLTLSGMACATGPNMEKHGLLSVRGYHRNGVLHGQGHAQINAGALWTHVQRSVTLEGIFNDGYMEGPVRGLDQSGNLIFVGYFLKGIPQGPCWLAKEGQGWLYGNVDAFGRFSGENIAYVYPDLYSALIGHFHQERLVEARASVILEAEVDPDTDILRLSFSQPEPDSPAFTFAQSDAKTIPCDWLLEDHYEKASVYSTKSKVDGAGDGLFAARDLPPDTIISYYNGLHIEPGENYIPSSCNYQIYVDFANTEGSPYVDIPPECTDLENYCASLAHKANHSFKPNCKFIPVDHPRFGRIPALKTIVAVRRDAELFSHYKYDTALAPRWYQEAWQKANCDEECT